jgi:hypothetical protein
VAFLHTIGKVAVDRPKRQTSTVSPTTPGITHFIYLLRSPLILPPCPNSVLAGVVIACNRRPFSASSSLRPTPLQRSKISWRGARCCCYRSARASPFHVAIRPDPSLPAGVPMGRCDGGAHHGSRDQTAHESGGAPTPSPGPAIPAAPPDILDFRGHEMLLQRRRGQWESRCWIQGDPEH